MSCMLLTGALTSLWGGLQGGRNDTISFTNGVAFRLDNLIYVKKSAVFYGVEEGQQNIDSIRAESGLTKVFVHYPNEAPTGPNHSGDTEEGDTHASN